MHVREFKGDPVAQCEGQITEYARENRGRDACQALWQAVIARAVTDLMYMDRCAERNDLKQHELQKLHRIRENPPTDFIQSNWFEEICNYLQIDAEHIRERIRSGRGSDAQDARVRQLLREHSPVMTAHGTGSAA